MKKKKYAIILICLLVIAIAIIAINIRIPKRISINQNISELSVTRGKDGVIQKIGDCDKIAGMINGIHVRTYSVVSILKGDASRTGWEYRLSYKDSDGKHKSIVISQSNIEYNGKSYTVEDTDMITDIINELAAVYSEYDSKIIKFNLTDLKNIIIKSKIRKSTIPHITYNILPHPKRIISKKKEDYNYLPKYFLKFPYSPLIIRQRQGQPLLVLYL